MNPWELFGSAPKASAAPAQTTDSAPQEGTGPWQVFQDKGSASKPSAAPTRSIGQQAKDLAQDASGGVAAVGDIIGSTPGFFYGAADAATQAAEDALHGNLGNRDLRQRWDEVMENANRGNLMNFLPDSWTKQWRNNAGYKAVSDTLNKAFQAVPQGYGNIAAGATSALGGSDEAASQAGRTVSAAGEIGEMALGGRALEGAHSPVDISNLSPEAAAVRQTMTPQQYAAARANAPVQGLENRQGYGQPVPDVPSDKPWDLFGQEQVTPPGFKPQLDAEDQARGMSLAEDQTGFVGTNRGGGMLPDELRQQQEAELNPPVENSDPMQRELFNQQQPDWQTTGGATPRTSPEPQPLMRQSFPLTDINQTAELGDQVMRGKELPPLDYPGTGEDLPSGLHQGDVQADLYARLNDEQRAAIATHPLVEDQIKQELQKQGLVDEEGNPLHPDAVTEYTKLADQFVRAVAEDPQALKTILGRDLFRKVLNSEERTTGPRDTWNKKLAATLAYSAVDDSRGNPVRMGLQTVRDTSENPFYRELADKLLSDETFKPGLNIAERVESHGKSVSGKYNTPTHTIHLKTEHAGSEQLLLHESVHARLYAAVQAWINATKLGLQGGLKQMPKVAEAVSRLNDLYEAVKANPGLIDPLHYGFKDLHEFLSEALTDANFQAKLASMKIPAELSEKGFYKYYWDAFVGKAGKILGFDDKSNTYMSEIMKATSDLMDKTDNVSRIHYADLMDGNKDLGFGNQLKKAGGPVEALQEASREFALDRRPIDQVIRDDLQGKKLEDFTGEYKNTLDRAWEKMASLVKKNLLIDTSLKLLMQQAKGTGPLIKWTTDQVSIIEREAIGKTTKALDSALLPFRRMFRSTEQRGELLRTWQKWQDNIGKADLTRADFESDRGWNVYKQFQGVHDQILKDVNAMRAQAKDANGKPLKPIERIPSYFHALWEGDYRIIGYDGTGQKKAAFGFKRWGEANNMLSELQKQHPNLKLNIESVKKDAYGVGDLSAFEEAIRVMSRVDDPITSALQKTYNEVLQRRGFGRTGIHRKGILGYLGSEGGVKGLRNMERAFDQYVNQAYRYIGNLKKQQVLADLQKIPRDMQKQIPETIDFLHDYVNMARGKALGVDDFDRIIYSASDAMGFGQDGPLRAVRFVSSIASLYWLTTPRFWASQAVQSGLAFPKLVKEYGAFDASKMFYDGWKQVIMPDAIARRGAKWAGDQHYLDATIKNLVGRNPLQDRPIYNQLDAAKELASLPAAWLEHNAARLPVFHMFENALREAIPNEAKRFEVAAEKMDYYMTNYNRVHAPQIYSKLGLAGEAARPLKMFSHNFIGQFLEYAKGMKDPNGAQAMAAFFGTQVAMGGLKGILFIAEANAIISMINYAVGTQIPTPDQILMKSNLPDLLTFGGMSTLTGYDVSSSVSAPGLPSMFSIPPLSFTIDMVKDVGKYLEHVAAGTVTDQDRLRAAIAVTPKIMTEYWKNLFTPEGKPTANPNDPLLRGNYRRGDTERFVSSYITAAKPLDEARVDRIMRDAKQELSRDASQKLDILNAMTSQIMRGEGISSNDVMRYVQRGGAPGNLAKDLVNRLKTQPMTGPEREQMIQNPSLNKIHKIETIQQYLDKQNDGQVDRQAFDPANGEIVPYKGMRQESYTEEGKAEEGAISDAAPPPSWNQRIPQGWSRQEIGEYKLHQPFGAPPQPRGTDDWKMSHKPAPVGRTPSEKQTFGSKDKKWI